MFIEKSLNILTRVSRGFNTEIRPKKNKIYQERIENFTTVYVQTLEFTTSFRLSIIEIEILGVIFILNIITIYLI